MYPTSNQNTGNIMITWILGKAAQPNAARIDLRRITDYYSHGFGIKYFALWFHEFMGDLCIPNALKYFTLYAFIYFHQVTQSLYLVKTQSKDWNPAKRTVHASELIGKEKLLDFLDQLIFNPNRKRFTAIS